MTAGPTETNDARRVRRALAAAALLVALLAAISYLLVRDEAPGTGPTVGEKIALLMAERASLQARADGEARSPVTGVPCRQPRDRCAGGALLGRCRARLRRLASRPASGLRPARRAERHVAGSPGATDHRGAACGAQGSRARHGRTRSAGRPRHRAADPVLHAPFVRRAVRRTPRVRAIRIRRCRSRWSARIWRRAAARRPC